MPVEIVRKESLAPGLDEIEYASGRVVYRSTVYFDGTEKRETFSDVTRTKAKQLHRARQAEVDSGKRPALAKTLLEVREEAFAYAQEMLDAGVENPPLTVGSLRNHRSAWRKRIEAEPIAKQKLDQIRQADALRFLRTLKKSGLATNTQNGTVSAIRFVLRFARDNGYMTLDPFHGIKRGEFPAQKPRKEFVPRVLSKTEIGYLVEDVRSQAFTDASDTLFTNAVILYVLTGMRLSELLGLRWEDVDNVAGILHVRHQLAAQTAERTRANPRLVDLKAGEARSFPMLPAVAEALVEQLDHEQSKKLGKPGHFVFTTIAGLPITQDEMKVAVRRAGRLSRLGRIGAQVLRRSFTTAIAHAGVPAVEAVTFTGHTPQVFDSFYAKPIREASQRDENVQKLLDWGIGGVRPDTDPTPEPI